MTEITKLLFGVDESDFSRESLKAVAKLIVRNRRPHISVFHGAPDPRILFSKFAHLNEADVEENMRTLNEESKICLDKAMKNLIQAGLKKEDTSAVLQEKCSDPAGSMLDIAGAEKIDVIGVARFGASTIGRHPIGSVSYRLATCSEEFPIWIVDHRVRSRNVLICLVGAPIGQRIIDHVVKQFSPLTDSRFTLFHVIPPYSFQAERIVQLLSPGSEHEREQLMQSMSHYLDNTKKILEYGKKRLVDSGIPERSIDLRKKPQEQGIARDILAELERGDYGILVAGRKGSKAIKQFGLGSKAYKLLCAARAFMISLVN